MTAQRRTIHYECLAHKSRTLLNVWGSKGKMKKQRFKTDTLQGDSLSPSFMLRLPALLFPLAALSAIVQPILAAGQITSGVYRISQLELALEVRGPSEEGEMMPIDYSLKQLVSAQLFYWVDAGLTFCMLSVVCPGNHRWHVHASESRIQLFCYQGSQGGSYRNTAALLNKLPTNV
jgi:hypothetical protein